ncbi:MAG: major capsid protein [Desulfotalea sp.]
MSELIMSPLDDAGYDLAVLSGAVNTIPNNYGRLRQMGIFKRGGYTTQRVVRLDLVSGRITLLPAVPVGGPATQAKRGSKGAAYIEIPHIPYNDRILASDLQGAREAGTMNAVTLEKIVMRYLTTMRNSHAITEEFMMMGAIKGLVVDGAGDEIVNLYTKFGATKKTETFAFGTAGVDAPASCRKIVRHIEDNILGDTMTGVHCLCSDTFFDGLIGDETVKEFFVNHEAALKIAGAADMDPRKGFVFGGITFEEYRAKAPNAKGETVKFIADGKAHFFPVGTTEQTYETYDAPADFLETVNTPGLPIYAKQVMDTDGKFVKLLTESNPLCICKRPQALVEGTA